MVLFRRHALIALLFLIVLGSCDRVPAPQQEDLSTLELRSGAWRDSATAAADPLTVDHPYTGSITVGDTLWIRVEAIGDADAIRSVDAKISGTWRKLSLPIFFPVSWSDTGTQRVKIGVYTNGNAFYDSLEVRVTDRSPTLELPDLGGDGSLRIAPDSTTRLFVGVADDGAIDSLLWDLDGDGTMDTATAPGDTLSILWTIDRILASRIHPFLRVQVRDDDGHEILDSIRLTLQVPPPRLLVAGPDTVSVGDSIVLDASSSSSAPVEPVLWPDGRRGTRWRTTAPATDTVLAFRAILRDSLGMADTAEHVVVVVADAPRIVAQDTIRIHAGRLVHLSAGAVQRFGSIVSWSWDLDGDGTFGPPDTLAGRDTTFESAGFRTVGIRATDDDGRTGAGALLVLVTDSVPLLSIAVPASAGPGDSVQLSASASDPDGDSLRILWIVDGDTTLGDLRKVVFATPGTKKVRAVARSHTPSGTFLASVSRDDSILVSSDPPTIDLGADTTVAWGGTWRPASASASDSDGSIVETTWDFDGDGSWDTTFPGWLLPTHRFLGDTGTVLVKARVSDDDGNQAIDSLALRLDPAPWGVVLSAPDSVERGTPTSVHLVWIDSMPAGSTVRWTTNDGLDSTRTSAGDADSVSVRGSQVDTLRVTAVLTSPSGAVTTRSTTIRLTSPPIAPVVHVFGPDTVSWNDSIPLAAEIQNDVAPEALVWSGGATGLSALFFAPAKDTTLDFTVSIDDRLGLTEPAHWTVVVVRDVPTAFAGSDTSVHVGTKIHFSGAATQAFGRIVSWGWDLDGDGIFTSSASSAGIDTTYESTGERTVVLRVQDDDGNVDLDTLVVVLADAAPVLAVKVPGKAGVLDSITLEAVATDDDGDSVAIHWIVDGDTTLGGIRKIGFAKIGVHTVFATATSFTPSGSVLTFERDSSRILVTSPISVSLVHPDTVFLDTSTNGIRLVSSIDAPGGVDSIRWSVDEGKTWSVGDLSGTFLWSDAAPGVAKVEVRAKDVFGGWGFDTGTIVVARALPVIALVDSIEIAADSRTTSIPMTASSRFRNIAKIAQVWRDLDGLHDSELVFTPGPSVSLPLAGIFPPGRSLVTLYVEDDLGRQRVDTIVVRSVGFRLSIDAPDTVAVGSNVHATASVIRWPTDRPVELMFGLGDDIVQDTVLDSPIPSLGPQTVMLQARFIGALGWTSTSRIVEGVDDPPIVQEFGTRTIVAGEPVDLSFTASREYGSIAAWLWDLSGAKGAQTQPKGVATHSNPKDGTLEGVTFDPGSRGILYGVVTDGGDTLWMNRGFEVIGPPVAMEDTLGFERRTGLDIGCEVGAVCNIDESLLVGNDSIGFGLQGTPVLFGGVNGATVDSNSDGRWLSLPIAKTFGLHGYRYIISNGFLLDTGIVQILIYEQTPVAVLDTSKAALPVASVYTESGSTWKPQYTWQYNFPLPSGVEFANFLSTHPKFDGAAMRTGNAQDATGGDSTVPNGADLLATDPNLGYYFQYGPADWMQGEEEILEFTHDIATRRNDGRGIPGYSAWTRIVMPVRFRRYVNTTVVPTARMKDFSASYDCSGSAKFSYQMTVAPLKNVHDGDVTMVTIFDASLANGSTGYGDKSISGTLTSLDGKTAYPVEIARNKDGDFEAFLPNNDGGTLDLVFTIGGFLDQKGIPLGQVTQKWLPAGFNKNASHSYNSTGGSFFINNGCILN